MNQEIKQRIEQIYRGEVPQGYKKTAVGIVPQEWEDKKLKNIGKFSKGKGLPGTEMTDTGLPCIGYGDIYTKYNFKFDKAQNYVSQEVANDSLKCKKNSLFFTCSGETAIEIGKCVCYTGSEDIYVGGDIAVLTANNQVAPLFVGYQQNIQSSIKQKARYGQGHSVVHIYSDSLGKLGVAYPKDTAEQQRITDILSKWDEAVSLQEKLIEKLELQKKALMQKLLTPKEEWVKVKLKEVVKVLSGYAFKSEKYEDNGDYKIITIANVKENKFDLSQKCATISVIPNDVRNFQVLKVGDILISLTGNVGRICKVDVENCLLNQRVGKVVVNEKYNHDYLYYYLQCYRFIEYMKMYAQGAAQDNLSVKDIYRYKIDIPKQTSMQKSIGEKIGVFDNYINLQTQKLTKLKQQQKAMQQLLLTGIVRV